MTNYVNWVNRELKAPARHMLGFVCWQSDLGLFLPPFHHHDTEPRGPYVFLLNLLLSVVSEHPQQPEKPSIFKEKRKAHFGVYCIFSKLNRTKPYGPTFSCDVI